MAHLKRYGNHTDGKNILLAILAIVLVIALTVLGYWIGNGGGAMVGFIVALIVLYNVLPDPPDNVDFDEDGGH